MSILCCRISRVATLEGGQRGSEYVGWLNLRAQPGTALQVGILPAIAMTIYSLLATIESYVGSLGDRHRKGDSFIPLSTQSCSYVVTGVEAFHTNKVILLLQRNTLCATGN
jgi:hypothetical protein